MPFGSIDLRGSVWQPHPAMSGKKREKQPSFLDGLRADLRRYRAEHNLTHAQVGKLIGVSRGAVQRFEAGTSMLRADELDALFALLRTEVLAFADELQGLVNELRAPGLSDDAKTEYLIDRIKALHTALESRGTGVNKPVK